MCVCMLRFAAQLYFYIFWLVEITLVTEYLNGFALLSPQIHSFIHLLLVVEQQQKKTLFLGVFVVIIADLFFFNSFQKFIFSFFVFQL